MAEMTQEQLDQIYLRGFKPDGNHDPLYFKYSNRVDYPLNFISEQTTTEPPVDLLYIGTRRSIMLNVGSPEINEDFWAGEFASASNVTPPGAKIINFTATSVPDQYGVPHCIMTVKFKDEDGNVLSGGEQTWNGLDFNTGHGSTADSAIDTPCYLCLIYRTDITPPQFSFGIHYELYGQPGSDPQETQLLTKNAVWEGTHGVWQPNQPFLSWYEENTDSDWYDEESNTPTNTTGGGGGSLYRPSTDIPLPNMPSYDVCHSDFIRIYNLTDAQFSDFGDFLWSSSFIDNILKNWASPFENIISVSCVPIANLNVIADTVQIGNVNTAVSANRLTNSRYDINMGTVNINKMFNGFQDFSPYQKIKIFLPYIGIRELNVDNFMGGSIQVIYRCEVFTGSCVAFIFAHKKGKNYIVDSYNGNIATQIPITGANFLSAYQASMNGLATMASGNVAGAFNSLLNVKPTYEKSGTMTGSSGRLGVKYPYLIFDTAQFVTPKNYRQLHGYMSETYQILGDCKGFTQVKYMDMKNISLTASEKDELKQILETGVYINDPPTP